MREFKFRVWSNGKMNYLDNPKNAIRYSCGEIQFSSGWNTYGEPTFNGDPSFELMQYTGLKDKNKRIKKEIYEGDIVSYQDLGRRAISEVVFYKGSFCIKKHSWKDIYIYIPINEKQEDRDMGSTTTWDLDIIVLGNIHENSELLKEGK